MAEIDASEIASEKTAVASGTKLGEITGVLKTQNQILVDTAKGETDKLDDLVDQGKQDKVIKQQDSKKQSLIAASLNMIKGSSKYMSGILKGMDLRALREMKNAMKEKMGAGWAGIKNVASNLTKTTKDIMGALLKGLGLAALWLLIDWLSEQDFEKLYNDITGWFKDFKANIEKMERDLRNWLETSTIGTVMLAVVDALTEFNGVIGGIVTTILTWKAIGWIANFAGSSLSLMWNALKLIFGVGGLIGGLLLKVTVWTTSLMFGEGGALQKLWKAVKAVFGPISPMNTSAINAQGWNKSNMFTKEGALSKLMRNVRKVFGVEGIIAKFLTLGGNWNPLNWFGKEGPIAKLFATISGAFGPEGRFAKIGTWVGEKVNKIKGFFSTGKEGGPLSKLMGFIGDVTDKIGSGWKSMKSAKWFTNIMGFFAGAKGVIGALLTPLRFLLMPLTWIFGIGAAVIGFVQGFMGKEGVKDERTLTTKIMDGLKGAFRGLLDFFVIDLVMMVQDVMNWFVDQWNNSIFGKVKQFGKFTFGEELRETTDKMMATAEGSGMEVRKASINVDDLLEKHGGGIVTENRSLSNAFLGEDKFKMSTEDFGKMIDNLGAGGLLQVQQRLQEMDKNENVELINKDKLIARLQEEMKERAAATPPTIIDNSTNNNNNSRSQQTIATNASSTDPTSQKNQLSDKQ